MFIDRWLCLMATADGGTLADDRFGGVLPRVNTAVARGRQAGTMTSTRSTLEIFQPTIRPRRLDSV
jgi:hypothetical protein